MKKSIATALFLLCLSSSASAGNDIGFDLPSKDQLKVIGVGLILDRIINKGAAQPQHPVGKAIRSINTPYNGSQCIQYQTPRFDPNGRYVGQRNRYQCFN